MMDDVIFVLQLFSWRDSDGGGLIFVQSDRSLYCMGLQRL